MRLNGGCPACPCFDATSRVLKTVQVSDHRKKKRFSFHDLRCRLTILTANASGHIKGRHTCSYGVFVCVLKQKVITTTNLASVHSVQLRVDICKHVDGGCKPYQVLADESLPRYVQKYAADNARDFLGAAGLDPPDFPIPKVTLWIPWKSEPFFAKLILHCAELYTKRATCCDSLFFSIFVTLTKTNIPRR